MEMALSGSLSTSSRGKYKIWLFIYLNVICAEFEDSVVCLVYHCWIYLCSLFLVK